MTIQEFGQTIKYKYPQYKNVDDTQLAQTMLKKYPEYQSKVDGKQSFPTGVGPGGANPLGRMLFPRGAAVQDKMIADQPVSLDERVGVGGEGINRVGGPILSLLGGGPNVYGVTGAIEGATTPGASVQQRAGNAVAQGGAQYLSAKALNFLSNYVQDAMHFKTVNPVKIAGGLRDEAVVESPSINTENLIKEGDKLAKLYPHAADYWDVEKAAFDKNMPTQDLLDKVTEMGRSSWTASGNAKDKAAASLTRGLYAKAREEIATQAPAVAEHTTGLKNALNLPNAMSAAQKASWLVLKLLGIGKLGGL